MTLAQTVTTDVLLELRDLRVDYVLRDGQTATAVTGVDLTLAPGDALGLAGESGCGKSTLALACMGLLPSNARVSGSVKFKGEEMLGAKPGRWRALRWAGISMVFQGAMNGLNPVKRIGDQIAEAVLLHDSKASPAAARRRAEELLEHVGIAARRAREYPHEFSGGMRQRAMIAMALACEPKLVIADEPTTALDVMIQAQIMQLLVRLRAEHNLALLLITHDLSVISEIAERVAIMYAGGIVEQGLARDVLLHPKHPYPQALVEAFPKIGDPAARHMPSGIPGDPPDPSSRPPGCPFHPRCPHRFEPCDKIVPALVPREGRANACHLYPEDTR
jgi:peptide/nickel transport system ATP-binding protein